MLKKLFGKNGKKQDAPAAAPDTNAPGQRVIYRGPNRQLDALRRGMWVVADQQIGIVVGFLADGTVEVHAVSEDGTTPMRYNEKLQKVESVCLRVPPGELRQAALAEIPKSRRPVPARAAAFGYR